MSPLLPIRCLPLAEWPAADREAWNEAVRSADLLDTPRLLAHMPKDKQRDLRTAYGRWLGFLGDALRAHTGLSGLDLVTEDTLLAFIKVLKASLAPHSVAAYITYLERAARAMPTDRDLTFLSYAATNLRRVARPAKDKRQRLKPTQELYELGIALMEAAEERPNPIKAAARFRDGMMIALLAARPVRLSNLASIDINRHLERHGEDYWLVFPSEEVKNRRHLEFPLPRSLTESMETYLSRYRPPLMASTGRANHGPHDGLWVSASGSKLSSHRIYNRIRDRTRERFGHSINPHLFRDAAATSVAIEDPVHVGIVAAILGHSTFRTAEQYYNQATSLEAARKYQATVRAYRA